MAACAKAGLDCAQLLAEAGLTAQQVDDPEGRLPGEAVSQLWRLALVRSGDPLMSLRAAESVPFGAYRVIDFLAASAATVGDGIARVARYFPLINSVVELRIHEAPREVAVELVNPTDPGGIPRPYAEYALAVTVLHCRRANGFDWPLQRVELAYPSVADTGAYERTLGCAVVFGEARTAFVLARETWSLPSQGASSELLRTLEDHADRLVSTLRSTEIEAVVARCVMEEMRGGDPSLPHVSKRLGMSPRTLQRKLQLENLSFNDVLDRTRKHFASRYVQERGLQLTEIAYLLGFSEQSAFTRAFQRWYGVSPTQYRASPG
jgi:AraC-like DNA-binding protein